MIKPPLNKQSYVVELQISSIEYCILDINLQRYTCAGINFMRIVCKKYRQII